MAIPGEAGKIGSQMSADANVVRAMKLRRLSWVGHTVRMGNTDITRSRVHPEGQYM